MSASVTLHPSPDELPERDLLVVVGRRHRLLDDDVRALLPPSLDAGCWTALLGKGDPGDDGRCQGTWAPGDAPTRVLAGVLPEACSRHNTPTRSWAVPRLLSSLPKRRSTNILVALEDAEHAAALALGIGRALPLYDRASSAKDTQVDIAFVSPDGKALDLDALRTLVDAVRAAAALVDRPPNDLDTRAFVAEARAIAEAHDDVTVEIIQGEELRDQGFGGLWGVGKAATSPPALVVLDHHPDGAKGHDAWVGKGITYDTGGLSIKTKTGMPGMKSDMGGAAAVLAAFDAAVRLGSTRRLTAVLCLAENSVGPEATRPDDVLTMYSGRTVEVNNTDAEGRLVLADGVAWVARHRRPERLIEVATLTGAQAIATGKRMAAVVCNDDDLEAAAVDAGRAVGELVHPLPFCPEYHGREFRSQVADSRNSVKDRSNAQSSCAAEFIRRHLPEPTLPWLHVDMAGPSMSHGRATGYGVGLLLRLAGAI